MHSDSIHDVSRSRFRIHALTIIAIVVACVFFNLGGYRTLGSHETYAVVPARGMLESGDWIVPRIGQEPRLRKPPLAYWIIATASQWTGRVTELSARMPQAISGLALVALIGFWTGRRFGRTAGLFAALVQGTSIYFLTFARKAEVDMFQCLCTTGCFFLISRSAPNESKPGRFRRWTAIYALLSFTWLAKFHFGLAMVAAPTALWFLLDKRKHVIRDAINLPGLLMIMAAVFVWPYLLLQQIPDAWEVWKTQTIGRAMGEMGQQPVWYYVPHLLWLTMPWTPIMLLAIPGSWRRAWVEGDREERFLWFWFLTDLAICTASANKHSHYLIVALPMLSIIAGVRLRDGLLRLQSQPEWLSFRTAMLLSLAIPVAAAVLRFAIVKKYPYLDAPLTAVTVTIGVGGMLTMLLTARLQNQMAGYTYLATLAITLLMIEGWVFPRYDHRVPARDFVRKVRQELGEDVEICAYHMDLTAVEYYVEEPCRRVESQERLADYVMERQDQPVFVIAYESELPLFESFATVEPVRTMQPVPNSAPPKHPPLVLAQLRLNPIPGEPQHPLAVNGSEAHRN